MDAATANRLVELADRDNDRFDDVGLKVAVATMALSIGFFGCINRTPSASARNWLAAAWALLLVALLLNLISLLTGLWNVRATIEATNRAESNHGIYGHITFALNLSWLLLVGLGIGSLVFAVLS